MTLTATGDTIERGDALTLPTVDISSLPGSDEGARAAVVQAIRTACLDKGFFYCVGHGIDPALLARVFAQSAAFFAQPMDRKMERAMALSKANRGYEPLRGQTLEPDSPPDLKEGYYIGAEVAADDERAQKFFNTGPNVWPEDLPDFRATMEEYYAAMRSLIAVLLEGLALSLGLDADYFADFQTSPIATLRLLHYPAQEANPHPDEKGCGAHTDFGAITVLMQDGVGGLEVWDHDGARWLAARPLDGSFIINLGDMMARWTNGRYRSTIHRVINRSGRERYSVPFFCSGNPEHRIACIPSCLPAGGAPQYAPITVEGHMRERYSATYKKDFG